MKRRSPPRLELDGQTIRCWTGEHELWALALDDLMVFGEMTDESGPGGDDYQFIFVRRDGSWFASTFYFDARDEFLAALSDSLGTPLVCGLSHSTTFASRVLWPPPLVGRPLFDFSPVSAADAWGRLRQAVWPRVQYRLSVEVARFLSSQRDSEIS